MYLGGTYADTHTLKASDNISRSKVSKLQPPYEQDHSKNTLYIHPFSQVNPPPLNPEHAH